MRAILEEMLTEVMFDLPSREDVVEVKVIESTVTNGAPPDARDRAKAAEEGGVVPTFTRDGEQVTTEDRLPVLPLREVVVFPHVVIPLLVGRPASLAAVEAAIAGDQYLPARSPGERRGPRSFGVGLVPHRGGRSRPAVRADAGRHGQGAGRRHRARARDAVSAEHEAVARGGRAVCAELARRRPVESRQAMARFEEYVALHRRIPDEVVGLVQAIESDERRAMAIAAHLVLRHDAKQALLDAATALELWTALVRVLGAEIELLRLERKIDDDVRGSLFQNQREFYLQEQLRAINRELGQDEGDDLGEVEAEITKRGLPEPVAARARRELRKLRRTAPMSPETTVGRNYLDWLLSLPWTARTDDVLDVEHARTVLDQDHYGLEDVKDRILDYIAVLALVGKLEGPILCLVGPPGVGKTSLGQSVARALGRRFVRMSLGGVRDEAEIRGHRRTYIGALPGRIIQAMKRAEVVNPVILLDEIDKLGSDYRGDPAAALLEVLDPEQNKAFNDHYLELDYDLSQVLFITTANSLQTIPEPLRDRMEILRLSGYLDHEKLAIARQFLVPRQLVRNGLKPDEVTWEADALPGILRGYTREAGRARARTPHRAGGPEAGEENAPSLRPSRRRRW